MHAGRFAGGKSSNTKIFAAAIVAAAVIIGLSIIIAACILANQFAK
ncbi:MAG: hypothetical protein WDN00_08305 [Limisphaerales bacterium]